MSETVATGNDLAYLRRALFEGRYNDAYDRAAGIRQTLRERTPARVLYAGACALFGLGHVLQAEEWVSEHGRASDFDASHMYLTGYVEIHRRRLDRALLSWTRIVQADPGETFADELIERLKRGEAEVLREVRDPSNFTRYVPLAPLDVASAPEKPRRTKRPRIRDAYRRLVLVLILLGLAGLGAVFLGTRLLELLRPDPYAGLLEELPRAPSGGTVTDPDRFEDEPPRFTYPDREAALDDYRNAREKIGAGLVNQARFLLGRLELSNASFEIKERARLLRDSIPTAPYSDFRDPISVRELVEEPYLYRGAQVLWTGTAENATRSEGVLRFDFRPGPEAGPVPDRRVIVLYSVDDARRSEQALDQVPEEGPIEVFGLLREEAGTGLVVRALRVTAP
ncbi:MAG: hypothetical protein H7A21_18075 [Spirochaetales bacterium]|nr:hypothetical protein [Leptospiraceae bacterium]MCP5483349.1 hypothetical protein [Spirochaetales bacterium]MCP5484138.1 hypothetical protein [Spirochaetales bacterium]